MGVFRARRSSDSGSVGGYFQSNSNARHRSAWLIAFGLLALSPAVASETITYTYDPRGRLVGVVHSGTAPTAGVSANYSYDKADNRTNVTVGTAGSSVSFSVASNGPVTEGGTSVFTVTKSGTASGSVSVNYATANGTAVAPGDYTITSGTLTFTTAQTSQSVSVVTVDDTAIESLETFSLNLSAPTGGAVIAGGTATASINDNEANCTGVSFAVSDTSVTEGGNLTFTVTRSGSTSSSCSVNYATANGTAAAGSDYTARSGTLTFSSAQVSQTVSVVTTDDTLTESAETVLLNLSAATSGATISDSQGVGTINDNDAPPCSGVSFAVADPGSTVEGDQFDFVITKSGTTSSSCSVNYATANGTAIAPGDYLSASGTLTFTSAATQLFVTVTTNADGVSEGTETMVLNLSGATGGATISDSQATGLIVNSFGGGGCCQLQSAGPAATSTTGPQSANPTTDASTSNDATSAAVEGSASGDGTASDTTAALSDPAAPDQTTGGSSSSSSSDPPPDPQSDSGPSAGDSR